MVLLGMERNGHRPTVVTLDIHLEGEHQYIFNPETTTSQSMENSNPPPSKLVAFFNLCSEDLFASTLRYHEVPEFYTWGKGEWKRRLIGGRKMYQTDNTVVVHSNTIGRLYSMSPKIGDLYYLRLLLVHQPGPKSFSHLKTVDGELLSTFKKAC